MVAGLRSILGSRAAWAAVVAAGSLTAPAVSHAAISHFGSNLSHAANLSESTQVDATWWQALLAPYSAVGSGATPTVPVVPADGQIVEVSVRGHVGSPSSGAAPYPPQPIAFQDLRPQADGSVLVVASSQPFTLPNTDAVYSYQPANLCVKQGDFVGFSDRGGFDPQSAPNGVPFQVFSSVSGSTTNRFAKNNGVNTGSVLTPTALPGVELLMQATLATGPDATALCPGGMGQTVAGVPPQTDRVTNGSVNVTVQCRSTFPCHGTVALMFPYAPAHGARARAGAKGSKGKSLGTATVLVGALKDEVVKIHLAGRGRKLLRKHHHRLRCGLNVVLTAGPSQTNYTGRVTLRGS